MKKKLALGLVGVLMVSSITGCGVKSDYLLDVKYSDYVTLCDYKGVEADKVVFEVSDDEVAEEIEMEMYEYAEYEEITDRGIEKGDYVVINYEAKLDGIYSSEYSGDDEEIVIGEEYFYPEVEEALIGKKTGEKVSVEAELTEDFAEEGDLGKKLSLEVTVGEITQETLPEYNDEFVKENTEYESVEAYNASVKEDLMQTKEEEYKSDAVSQIIEYIVNNSTFNGYPEELYAECEEYYNATNESYAAMYGMEPEEYFELFGLDEETQKAEIIDSVNYELVIGAVAQKEGIGCRKSEIKKFVKDNYGDFGFESEDEFYSEYTEEDVGYQLVYEKVADFLYEHAEYAEIDEETYLKQRQEEMYGDEDDDWDEDFEDAEDADEDETVELEGIKEEALEAPLKEGEDTTENGGESEAE